MAGPITHDEPITLPKHAAPRLPRGATTNEETRRASGSVNSEDPLVLFFYLLLRDHMLAGKVEELVMEVERASLPAVFTNGGLATYAHDLAARVRKP